MKIGRLLIILAITVVIVGSGLSFLGYQESLQLVTTTNTLTKSQIATGTSTAVIAATSTEYVVTTSVGQLWVLQDEVVDLEAKDPTKYCGTIDSVSAYIDAGQVHVSYESNTGVSFWMLDEKGYGRWTNERSCSGLLAFKGIVTKLHLVRSDFTINVASGGDYYFAFLNEGALPAHITLNVDQGVRSTQSTLTMFRTVYSTRENPYTKTEVLVKTDFTTHSAGLGSFFFLGVGILSVGVLIAIFSRISMRTSRPVHATQVSAVPSPAASVAPASKPTALKYCIGCGASLPVHAVFCNKCRAKQ